MIMCLHSRTFCLEEREWRVGQFKSRVEGADDHFVHSFAANPWMDSNLSERVMEGGVLNAAAVIKPREDQGLVQV